MKHAVLAGLIALVVAGCGGGGTATETKTEATTQSAAETTAETTAATASGCAAGGLDAMSALADFQLEMDNAQKAGKITLDQLTAGRDKLFNETQAAQAKEDWTGYCASIDDMRAELGL